MIAYTETFMIGGKKYGIEDLKDGRPREEHFFPEHAQARFHLWMGGDGIGWASTIDEAWAKIHEHARMRLETELGALVERLANIVEARRKLGTDPINLVNVLVNEEKE